MDAPKPSPTSSARTETLSVDLRGYKAPLRAWCAERGVSPSQVIRLLLAQLLEMPFDELRASHLAETVGAIPEGALRVIAGRDEEGAQDSPEPTANCRVTVNLTANEYDSALSVAAADQFGLSRWFVAALRARLTKTPQFGQHELEALARSNRELWAIGRNLNQVARALNAMEHSALNYIRPEQVDEISAQIKEHTRNVSALMAASYERWRMAP